MKPFIILLLAIPWLAVWLLGTLCALLADGFLALQDRLARTLEELNQAIQKI